MVLPGESGESPKLEEKSWLDKEDDRDSWRELEDIAEGGGSEKLESERWPGAMERDCFMFPCGARLLARVDELAE